ncbi:MAG: hypothetical protein EOO38_00855 [Cytophagaceae bacterium]|nr:MAG: hypothetical protein EOO38_00855 [Cytophagaceae bacterium]
MPKITELWAWVCQDKGPDDEGVPSMMGPDRTFLPLVGSDLNRMSSLKMAAQEAANKTGRPVTLRRSTGLVDVMTVYPKNLN